MFKRYRFSLTWIAFTITIGFWLTAAGVNPLSIGETWLPIPKSGTFSDYDALALYAEQLQNFIGAMLLVAGGAAGALTLDNAHKRTEIQDLEAETNRDRLNSEIFSRAVEQLGTNNIATRIGAIYSLESLAQDELRRNADGTLVEQIAETLAAFVREAAAIDTRNDRFLEQNDSDVSVDVEAAVCVLSRSIPFEKRHRIDEDRGVNLSYSDLQSLELPTNTDLRRFNFTGCNLQKLKAHQARWEESILDSANLDYADIRNGSIVDSFARKTDFSNANLSGCFVQNVEFFKAKFDGCALDRTRIYRCEMDKCTFANASFIGSDLSGADFSNAIFDKGAFSDVSLAPNLIHKN